MRRKPASITYILSSGTFQRINISGTTMSDPITDNVPGRQVVHEYEPTDEEPVALSAYAAQQESCQGSHGSQELVPRVPVHSLQPFGLQYFFRRVSCSGEGLIAHYRSSRKLLGNNVEAAHAAWRICVASDSVHPLVKASTMSFGTVSTPETIAHLSAHWKQLWQQMHEDRHTPDYEIARFMAQYAVAWGIKFADQKTALAKVRACYNDMKKLDPDNFFLAPYYTVTIGRWIYEVNEKEHTLSVNVIMQVYEYAIETLRLIKTLEDDWARADTFAAMISAFRLLMIVEDYLMMCHGFAAFRTKLYLRIESLYAKIKQHLWQRDSEILLYDRAWFHSVSANYYLRASKAATSQEQKERMYALYHRSLEQSASLYFKNGRWWRAKEEALRTADRHVIQAYSEEHCSPSI